MFQIVIMCNHWTFAFKHYFLSNYWTLFKLLRTQTLSEQFFLPPPGGAGGEGRGETLRCLDQSVFLRFFLSIIINLQRHVCPHTHVEPLCWKHIYMSGNPKFYESSYLDSETAWTCISVGRSRTICCSPPLQTCSCSFWSRFPCSHTSPGKTDQGNVNVRSDHCGLYLDRNRASFWHVETQGTAVHAWWI